MMRTRIYSETILVFKNLIASANRPSMEIRTHKETICVFSILL